jgi:CrcB protein
VPETTTEPVDPDLSPPDVADSDLPLPRRRRRWDLPWAILVVVAVGGAVGALARYGLVVAFPRRPGGFPWATFGTNVSGCLLVGVLLVLVTEVWAAHRLLRPFLGTGVLGGFTTFSTYTVDVQQLITTGSARTALAYLAGTLIAAVLAGYLGVTMTRVLTRRQPSREAR